VLLKLERALLTEKQRILRQCSYTEEVMESPEASGDLSQHRTHVADQGTENYQREMASRLKSIESRTLREIDEALRRIAAGTYGVCAACGGPISVARLEIVPHARVCMKCLRDAAR
jgi:RNA polymerase-binding protein DksA